eukprot:1142381-Pelagomonas_calceolata.AAC.3
MHHTWQHFPLNVPPGAWEVAGLILMAYHVARAIHEKRMKSKCQQDCATSETLPVQQPQV